ncbi:unnamed protein product [Rotaria magnacalcarata]|uniref:Uncharacterized protein n=3 Tax=Rotaria magnacalcarata TaxID=392030 RepID=A0A816X2C8_9BILA|nr:unnamed protein product [Rotaria magnacalcarata]CAF2141504.1 unnamed protein product [Rotaria magnacalcarata]CAF3811718.1 unnamed protein product [Rotaria magnacalcarata]CAF4045010.1 unnamed protein product [Rotaria magnacalcarata]
MARPLLVSLSQSIINNIRISRSSFLLDFRRYNSSSIASNFDPSRKDDVKTRLLTLLTKLRDNDIPKLDGHITCVLNVTEECIEATKFNKTLKNVQTLLPNDINKLKNDLTEFIFSLQSIPTESFETDKIDTFLLFNEEINRQHIDKEAVNNIFQDLTNVIDDLWIAKRSKLKLRAAIQDLKSLLSHLQDENIDLKLSVSRVQDENIDLKLSVSRVQEENIDLKLSVSRVQDENALYKYHSCLNELMRQTAVYGPFSFTWDDSQHEEIKDSLNLDDKQIHLMLTIFDTICSKYGFPNKHILVHYLLVVSIRNEQEHDMMDSYVKLTSDDRRSFQMYCEKNNLVQHYEQKHYNLLEGLFKLYETELIRKLKKQENLTETITQS